MSKDMENKRSVKNILGGGGGLQQKKTEDYSEFKIFDRFFWFFRFFGFSILADFDWSNGFWLSGSCWL